MREPTNKKLNEALRDICKYMDGWWAMTNVEYRGGKWHYRDYEGTKGSLSMKEMFVGLGDTCKDRLNKKENV